MHPVLSDVGYSKAVKGRTLGHRYARPLPLSAAIDDCRLSPTEPELAFGIIGVASEDHAIFHAYPLFISSRTDDNHIASGC